MGKLSRLVSTPEGLATFRVKYNIPRDLKIRPCEEGEVNLYKGHGRVVIPLVTFVEGGV